MATARLFGVNLPLFKSGFEFSPPVAEFRSLVRFCVCRAVKFRALGSLVFAKKRIGEALFYLALFGGALKTRARIHRLLERFYPNLQSRLNAKFI